MIELLLVAQLACVETYPGAKRPLDWSYRTVDGKKCWYQGPRMLPKDNLRWEAPVVPPEDDGSFQSRWRLK